MTDELVPATPDFMARRPGRSWHSREQITAGLLFMVTHALTSREAAEALDVKPETFKSWTFRYSDEVRELHAKYGPDLEAQAVAGLQSFIVAANDVKRLALEKTRQQLEDGTIKDPARALQSISVAQGISVQKVLELTGRPTAVVHHQSMQEIVARLRSLGAEVEGTAEPMVDSDVIEAPHASPPVGELTQEATAHGNRNDHATGAQPGLQEREQAADDS